jgi:translation initiation factor IF-3
LGVYALPDALNLAREQNLDLVEVAPTASPPVCRLLDYGRYRYKQAKRERQARKAQRITLLKELRLRLKINEHDIQSKTRLAEKFLGAGDRVKFNLIFRGREVTHPQLGQHLLEKVARSLKDTATVEKPPSLEGRNMTLILAPLHGKASKDSKKVERAVDAKT